ncbi:DUF6431 domain-containing protein [Lacrimispora xylanisolvens]|uniref:DUF6431 domain-containing protein n=1 Tax=Lacrimispora xylanisolvens TaxID=384636 RepID=UPI003D9CA5B2
MQIKRRYLTIHGYYHRSIKSEESVIRLHICRVKCSYCGTTHALLLSSIVPYSQISLSDQVSIISCYEDSGDFSAINFSLCTFDAIDLTNSSYLSAGGLGVFSNAAFAHHA